MVLLVNMHLIYLYDPAGYRAILMVHWYQWYDWKIENHILAGRKPDQVEACNGCVRTSKGPQIHPNVSF